MILTPNDYCQFLTSSHINFTCTYYAEHKEEFSHDSITRFLANTSIPPNTIFKKAVEIIVFSPRGYFIFDDSVMDKNFSRNIEMVRKQYSGNAHRVIRGIGLVGCIYYNPDIDECWLLDYRIYDIENDQKKKTDHMLDIIDNIENQAQKYDIEYVGVLCDAAYSTVKLFNKMNHYNKVYVCNIKSNRKARSFGTGDQFVAVKEMFNNDSDEDINTTRTENNELNNNLNQPIAIQLNKLNSTHKTKIFKSQVSNDRTDYLVTNCEDINTLQQVQKVNAYRWKIEQFHRELKQTTGIEQCQRRRRKSQKNHIICSLMVWIDLKQKQRKTNITIYQQKEKLLSDYLRQELKNPTLKFEW